MSPQQALSIINQGLSEVMANRDTHVKLQTAYQVVEGVVNANLNPKADQAPEAPQTPEDTEEQEIASQTQS